MELMGYVKNHGYEGNQALVLDNNRITNKKHYKLLNEGWEHVLSLVLPSTEDAYKLMQNGIINANLNEIRAFKEHCRCCQSFSVVTKVVGRRYNHRIDKLVVFNGLACEQCINEFQSVRFY